MPEADETVLFWHRRDLRGPDNRGLARAADRGSVVPVFCLDDDLLATSGPGRVSFMLDALEDLAGWYAARDSGLRVLHGDPSTELPALVDRTNADAVVWNADYSGYAQERDAAVADAVGAEGAETVSVTDAVLHEPGSIRTSAGEPYSVFSYYWKKWRDRAADAPARAPDAARLASVDGDPLPDLDALGLEEPTADVLEGTRSGATDRLEEFLAGPIYEYADRRDVPAADATSRLSQDLKFGLLGPREVYASVTDARDRAPDDEARESATEFLRQLAWREFYAQVLAFNPETVTEDFDAYENPIEWRDDPAALEAWKRGETGYPIVDAGMRQLRREGYLHNRVRMIVASFLTKDLLIDWREGYRHFRRHLLDHDTASDVGGWQWAASTGTDAQPYFRIFNPMTQGERYDPDGAYVRSYVGELAGVDAEAIHGWPDLDPEDRASVAPEYFDPIVDHAERREEAIAMFERARGET